MIALIFAPVKKTEFEGRVILQEDNCFLLRNDDNTEQWYCDVKAMAGSRMKVTTYTSLSSLFRVHVPEAQNVTFMNETIDDLLDVLSAMTLKEKLGQMLIVRTEDNLAAPLNFVPGGYILFANDFRNKTEAEIQEMTRFLQTQPYGALLMVDEEGGSVVRISSSLYTEGYPSAQTLFQQGGWNAVEKNLVEKSELLRSLGIQVNLNPVADISTNPQDYIYARTFGQDAKLTSQYVSMAVRVQKEVGLLSCLKHFPGYAGNSDTHVGFSKDARSLGEYQNRDFLPFLAGIQAGSELIMMSHVIMEAVDPDLPASLSIEVHETLREELNYDGLILSDDLMMDAIADLGIDSLCAALKAGNDLLLTTDPNVSIDILLKAAEMGELSLNQIDESVLKILKIKEKLGLLK